MTSSSEHEQTAQFLWSIANRLSTTCPAASRYYMCSLERILIRDPSLLKKDTKRSYLYCNHCGSLWAPGNHGVQITPPPTANRHIKKLLKCEAFEPWKLNNQQKKKLKKFRDTTSKIVYSCHICHKTTVFPGIRKYGKKEIVKQPFNTPVSKIKCKKGDLNAGLFIKTPSEKDSQDKEILNSHENLFGTLTPSETIENITESKISHSSRKPSLTSSTPETAISSPLVRKYNTPQNQHQTPYSNSSHKALSSQKQKKKKKSLLAEILNEEKSSTKKKTNLSSFLVSL